ncbi:phospholipase A2-like [Vespa mandarinia]|uniref:phospholipase A2-like n=1 Tax=Vespa mandarinia TaxID=7446 RepID=UPI001617B5BB|nr:phospholipase A2-like [Vespa mandarinia]
MCYSNINSGEEKYRLLNNGIFTRSHCSCDFAFYDCLKNAKSIIAKKIGFTYFDLLSPQCFNEDYPIIKCNKYSGPLLHKCIDYMQDKTEEKKYQWFDNKNF